MIINKVTPYWTEEERARVAEIDRQQSELMDSAMRARGSDEFVSLIQQYDDLGVEADNIISAVGKRYARDTPKKTLISDAKEIINALENEDYVSRIQSVLASLQNNVQAGRTTQESVDFAKSVIAPNYENCFNFILSLLKVYVDHFANDDTTLDMIRSLIGKRVALWYTNPRPFYIQIAHGKPLDALAFMNSRSAYIDDVYGHAKIERFGVEIFISQFKKIRTSLGISTDKLLTASIAEFTKQNNFKANPDKLRRDVEIDLRYYASLLGYDVLERDTTTPEEAKKEKKRIKIIIDNVRNSVKKDLDIIHATTLKWEETIKGTPRDFRRVSLVTTTAVERGKIKISFTPEIAGYLAERQLYTQIPVALFGLDERNPNAYYIGRKMSEHYNMDNNIVAHTQNRLSIATILSYTDLPKYEDVQKTDRGHWQNRIKEPLERALDILVSEGVLKDWKYTHAKGIDLTDEEADIVNYSDFSDLYIEFKMADTIDHTERIEANRKKLEESKAKKKAKQTASKK